MLKFAAGTSSLLAGGPLESSSRILSMYLLELLPDIGIYTIIGILVHPVTSYNENPSFAEELAPLPSTANLCHKQDR